MKKGGEALLAEKQRQRNYENTHRLKLKANPIKYLANKAKRSAWLKAYRARKRKEKQAAKKAQAEGQ